MKSPFSLMRCSPAVFFVLIMFVVVHVPAGLMLAIDTARVEVKNGAPRIVIDSRPVRARMFWGGPGTRPLPIPPELRAVSFDFTPLEDEAKSTLHFRFGETPGEVVLDDLRIIDLKTGQDVLAASDFESGDAGFVQRWSIWPPGEKNTVGEVKVKPGIGKEGSAALQITLKKPVGTGTWPDFHIHHKPIIPLRADRQYRVSFFARANPARELRVAFYRPGLRYVFLGGPQDVFGAQIKLAADVGVDFVSFPVGMPWPRPGEAVDWSSTDIACRTVLRANPRALLIPRVPMGAPRWWLDAHPDDEMKWDKGEHSQRMASVASAQYRKEAGERLAALIAHLEEKFGKQIAGYHPCGQNTGEWFYEDTWGIGLNGYNKGDLLAWRAWLKARYVNDGALRTAWNDPSVALDAVEVPSPEMRRAAPLGMLRDPATEYRLIDFAQFQQEMMAQCVIDFARAARQASTGKKLVVFFYGYGFEFGAVSNGAATSGHYGLRRVLDSPDIDILCSPISYFDRGLGQCAPAMTAAESIALAGKMWLYEDDTRTHLGTGRFPGWQDAVDTIEKSSSQLLRNTAQCGLRNFGSWWMDLGMTGWFNDAGMWQQMNHLKSLDQWMLDNPTPFVPEVAAVYDEASMLRVAAGGHALTRPGLYEARRPLGRMGAPYGQYLLEDVLAGRTQARMYVMLTPWYLQPEQRQKLLQATRGTLRVWCYAPGFQEQNRLSLDAMRELTGFQVKRLSKVTAIAEPTANGKTLGLSETIGVKKAIEPLFAVTDARPEEILATYPDGSVAIAIRQTGDGASLFVGAPGLSSELLRLAARQSRVHLYARTDCNVYANGPFVVLHGSKDGPIELHLKAPQVVRDAVTNQPIGQGDHLTLPMMLGQTRVLRLEPAGRAGGR